MPRKSTKTQSKYTNTSPFRKPATPDPVPEYEQFATQELDEPTRMKAAIMGCGMQHIRKWESGYRIPSASTQRHAELLLWLSVAHPRIYKEWRKLCEEVA